MLMFSAADMHYAAIAAKAWAERYEDVGLNWILQTAMIVIYARPFAGSNFFDFKKEGIDYRPIDSRLAGVHDRLMDMRGRVAAHTDQPAKSGRQIGVGMTDTAAGPVPGMLDAFDVFMPDSLEALLELFDSQKRRFETDAVTIMRELNGNDGVA